MRTIRATFIKPVDILYRLSMKAGKRWWIAFGLTGLASWTTDALFIRAGVFIIIIIGIIIIIITWGDPDRLAERHPLHVTQEDEATDDGLGVPIQGELVHHGDGLEDVILLHSVRVMAAYPHDHHPSPLLVIARQRNDDPCGDDPLDLRESGSQQEDIQRRKQNKSDNSCVYKATEHPLCSDLSR